MGQYVLLPNQDSRWERYALIPIRYTDREAIRVWRNAQIDVLRQSKPLTVVEQDTYFQRVVLPTFEQERPQLLLFSLLHEDELVAYGGLVHVSWDNGRAEVSFLADPARAAVPDLYRSDLLAHLRLLGRITFEGLRLHRLYTETFDIRPAHVAVLEEAGFRLEGRLRDNVRLASGKFADSLIHGQLIADYADAFGPAV